MCIAIVSSVMLKIFEINLIFLIKLFFCMTKKLKQKFKYFENEKSVRDEIKSTFRHF